jgi:hypothetical protein
MTSPEKNPSDPLSGTGPTQIQGTSQIQSGAEATQGGGEHLTERARRKAGELVGDLKRQAEASAEDMRQRARSAIDQQKDTAIGGIEGVAHALRSASDDLREQGQPLAAECSRQAADGLESLANWVSRRKIDDVTGGVEDFARQRPVAFIGGAMVAGFALARFMKSSSARRYRRTGEYGSYQRHEAYGGMGSAGTRTGAGTRAPGTARSTASGSWAPGGAERDAGTIGTPGMERDAGTIATPGVGTAGRPGAGSAGTQGTARAGTSRAGTAGIPGAGGDGRGQHGDV